MSRQDYDDIDRWAIGLILFCFAMMGVIKIWSLYTT